MASLTSFLFGSLSLTPPRQHDEMDNNHDETMPVDVINFTELPTELQELIISFVAKSSDLSHLGQTSKSLASLVERHLYRDINLRSTVQAGQFSYAVRRNSRSRYVRGLSLDDYDSNLGVYDWAIRQLPDDNKSKDDYLRGQNFSSRILSHFRNIEHLSIHARIWPFREAREEMAKIGSSGTLKSLRSCSLAFKPSNDDHGDWHWDLAPWDQLFFHPDLEYLELVRADGRTLSSDIAWDFDAQEHTTSLKSLRLLDCHISHNWLASYFRLPKSLESLTLVVTSRKSESFAKHMFENDCECMKFITGTLVSLTCFNLRSITPTDVAWNFTKFTHLKTLTVSAGELFGNRDLTQNGPPAFAPNAPATIWTRAIPYTLEELHLLIHRHDTYGDENGQRRGVWKVLFDGLEIEYKRKGEPVLKRIVLQLMMKYPRIPFGLVEAGIRAGIRVRMATTDELMEMRKRHRFEMLMS